MSWLVPNDAVKNYKRALASVVSDEILPKDFRKNSAIDNIWGIHREKMAQDYYDKLCSFSIPENYWIEMRKNDSIGEPSLVSTPAGEFAPTTLRYACQIADAISKRVTFVDKHVVEIGGGYGGFARLVTSLYSPKSYTIIDIVEASTLARRYNAQLGSIIVSQDCETYNVENVDVVISNYAVSELSADEQQRYFDNVIRKSSSGYITWNAQPRYSNEQESLSVWLNRFKEMNVNVAVDNEKIHKSDNTIISWLTGDECP